MRQCFIISQPRAGSTLLQRLLATHPQIQTIGEPWLAIPFVYALREKGVSAEYIHVSMAQGFGDFVSKLPGGRADYFQEVRAMLERLQQKIPAPGKTYFLDKTPRYHLILEELAEIFPDAKFIVL
ncbi:MAG TPA: sulfotransferase, partial [Methylomirabilota bacterium]|nr:sulfotransferase [Methylomirabilota bacterium]